MKDKTDIVALTSGQLDKDTNLPRLEARAPITSLDDYEPFGEIDAYMALGITALPSNSTDEGHAEGVLIRDVGNQDGVVVGARDDRCSSVYADLKPGSTVLHSTEPEAKAQVRCDPDGQVSQIVTDADGKTAAMLFDGKNNKFQVAAFGGWIEMSQEQGIVLIAPGASGPMITMKDGVITFYAKTVLLGGPASTQPVIIGSVPPGAPNVSGVMA